MEKQKICILHNPKSGKHKSPKYARVLKRALDKIGGCSVKEFESKSFEALDEFMETKAKHFDVIVIIGGDGTVGPTVNAMRKFNVDVPIYCYGRGTANDYASFFKTNCSPKRAAKAILRGLYSPVDTLFVNNEMYACNVACGGAFTNGVTKYSVTAKKIFGKLAYVFSATRRALSLKSQIMRFVVDGQVIVCDCFLFYILNTKNVGGLKNASSLSEVNDGMLDLVVLRRCGFWGKISLVLHQAFGKMHKCKHIKHLQGKDFTVEHVEGAPQIHNFTVTDIDGNGYGPYPLHVTVGPKIHVVHADKIR